MPTVYSSFRGMMDVLYVIGDKLVMNISLILTEYHIVY